jgi:glutamyl-tRNA synthetase
MADLGLSGAEVRTMLAASLGLAEPDEPVTMADLVARFDPARLPRQPWIVDPNRTA